MNVLWKEEENLDKTYEAEGTARQVTEELGQGSI